MDQFLNGAGSKAFDIALKSGMSFATTYAMKRMTKVIDEQINKTITTVVSSASNFDSIDSKNKKLANLESIRDRIEIKITILTTALDQILSLGSSKGIIGMKTCSNCSKLITPITENLEKWINEDTNTIENFMSLLENDIDTVCGYLQLSIQVLATLDNVEYEKTMEKSNSLNVSQEIVFKSGLLIADTANSNIFECTFYNLTSFHENTAIWKEVCRRVDVTFEMADDYNAAIKLYQNLDDDLYHDLEDEKNYETQFSIEKIEKIFFNKDASTIGFGEIGDECIVLKFKNNKWIALSKYHPYSPSDSASDSDEESTNDEESFKSTKEKKINKLCSIELLSTSLKLLMVQSLEQQSLLTIPNDILNNYITQVDMISRKDSNTDQTVEIVMKGVDELNI